MVSIMTPVERSLASENPACSVPATVEMYGCEVTGEDFGMRFHEYFFPF